MDYSFPKHGFWRNRRAFSNRLNRCEDKFICDFGSWELNNMTQWVICRFSCNTNEEHLIALGDEEGFVTLADIRHIQNIENFMEKSKSFRADTSVIMDCQFVPGAPNRLITISGSKRVCVWDVETQNCVNCIGHELSVRAISLCPDNPYCFLTGGRDGVIFAWDTRLAATKLAASAHDAEDIIVMPHRRYSDAHVHTSLTPRVSAQRSRKRPRSSGTATTLHSSPAAAHKIATITALLHVDEKYFLSASSSWQSGIRLWDLRYQQCSKPVRVFDVSKKMSKDCGLTSLCWDRYRSRFYSTCTDNSIYEYALWSKSSIPIRSFHGAKIGSFYVQCAASPITDHLACGSSDGNAFMWDLQEERRYMQDDCHIGVNYSTSLKPPAYLPYPKYKFGGHKNEVSLVTYSHNGNYMLTMDDVSLRFWDSTASWFRPAGADPTERLVDGVPLKIKRPQLLPIPDAENNGYSFCCNNSLDILIK